MKYAINALALILFIASQWACKTSQKATNNFPKSIEDAQMRADFQELRQYLFINTVALEKGYGFSENIRTEISDVSGEIILSCIVGDVGSTKVFFKTQNHLFCVYLSLGEGGKDFAIWQQKFELVYESIQMTGQDNEETVCHRKRATWESNEISPNQITSKARKLFIDH